MKLLSTQIIVNTTGDIIMGPGRLAILESINRTGSINQTAKDLRMSYKTVWSKIKSTEKNLGKSVVIADRRTGSSLTKEGRILAQKFKALKHRCIHADDHIFSEIFCDNA